MPTAPPTACPCGGKRQRGEACDRCGRGGRKQARKDADARRPNFRQRGYTTSWTKYSEAYRKRNPLCAECQRNGRVTAGTCVDHIVPHRQDYELMWNPENHQTLCDSCHGAKSARERL